MVVRKKKGKLMVMYEKEANEIESFTLLKLNEQETNQLLALGDWKKSKNGNLTTKYESRDPLDKAYREIAKAHRGNNPNFKEVNRTFQTEVEGTAALVRNPEKHVIKVVTKRSNLCTINRTPIDTSTMHYFFNDCKKGYLYNEDGIWGLDSRDPILYDKWDKYMNNSYLSLEKSNEIKSMKEIIEDWKKIEGALSLLDESRLYNNIVNINSEGELVPSKDKNVLSIVKDKKTSIYYLTWDIADTNYDSRNIVCNSLLKWYKEGLMQRRDNLIEITSLNGWEFNDDGICISGRSILELLIKLNYLNYLNYLLV